MEEPLEGINHSVKDSLLAFWPALHHGDDVIHIAINMGEALSCVGRSVPVLGFFCYGSIGRYGQLHFY